MNYFVDKEKSGEMTFNGAPLKTDINEFSAKPYAFIEDGKFEKENVVNVWY